MGEFRPAVALIDDFAAALGTGSAAVRNTATLAADGLEPITLATSVADGSSTAAKVTTDAADTAAQVAKTTSTDTRAVAAAANGATSDATRVTEAVKAARTSTTSEKMRAGAPLLLAGAGATATIASTTVGLVEAENTRAAIFAEVDKGTKALGNIAENFTKGIRDIGNNFTEGITNLIKAMMGRGDDASNRFDAAKRELGTRFNELDSGMKGALGAVEGDLKNLEAAMMGSVGAVAGSVQGTGQDMKAIVESVVTLALIGGTVYIAYEGYQALRPVRRVAAALG